MKHFNFAKSFLEWQSTENIIGRFNIECAIEKNGDTSKDYFLGSSVYACNVLKGGELFKYPPYLFTPLFSKQHFTIFRNDIQNKESHNYGEVDEVFKRVNLIIHKTPCFEITDPSIHSHSIHNGISGSFKYNLDKTIFTIHFPVKHINYCMHVKHFQVETGPVALPCDKEMKFWMLGFIAFNDFHSIEFLPINSTSPEVDLYKPLKINTSVRLFAPKDEK